MSCICLKAGCFFSVLVMMSISVSFN